MNKRIERINSLLKRDIAEIISQLQDPRIQGFITVSNVQTAPDLKYAKVFLSIYKAENKTQTLEAIKKASGFIRSQLSDMVDFRCVPSLNFELDNSAEYSQKIEGILKEISTSDTNEK